MKKVNVVLAAVFAMGFVAQGTAVAQTVNKAKDDLFAGTEVFEKNATDVTEITMDPDSLAMVNGKDKDKAHNTVLQTVRTYEYDKPGMYSMDEFQAYSKKLTDGTWNCSIHVRSKTGSTDICSRAAADHESNEMVILTAEPRELTFIHMSGKMSLNELSNMSRDATRLEPHGSQDILVHLNPEPKVRIIAPDTPTPPAAPVAPGH